jgi:malate dehydrogenase (oxaloacetate-decarboxylating)
LIIIEKTIKKGLLLSPHRKHQGKLQVQFKVPIHIGVPQAGILAGEMIQFMNQDPIIFAMSNPIPEIMPEVAKQP